MKKSLLLLTAFCSVTLLVACGSGGPPPPAATHLSVSSSSLNTYAGAALSITVTALDATGAVVPSYSGTVHFSSTDAQAVLPGNSPLTNGTGGFQVTLKKAGNQTVTVTDTVTASITGTSSAFTVAPGSAAQLSFSISPTETAGVGTGFGLTAQDAFNNAATGYTGTVHFTSTDHNSTLPANSQLPNGGGEFNAILNTAGNQTITATDTVNPSITGNSGPINVTGFASHFSITTPATATAGSAFGITVTALDAADNVSFIYTGIVHFTSSDSQANLPADAKLINGVAGFGVGLKTLGNQTVTATDTVTTSITGTSSAVNVNAAVAANPVPLINLPPEPDATSPGGAAFPLTVHGTGFVPGSKVNWNGSQRATSFVNSSQLTANILATDIGAAETPSVTVVNPGPGGGTSNVAFYDVTNPASSVMLNVTSQTAFSRANAAYTADFNGDGKLDLVVGGDTVSILLGNGDGTFQAPVDLGVGGGVAIGDFNGDGKLDLVVSTTVFLGKGDGTFQPGMQFPGLAGNYLAAADLNGDGRLDLVLLNGAINILLGNGDGTLQPRITFDASTGHRGVAIGDFNGDGKLDLALGGNNPSGPNSQVSIVLGNGDGTFQAAVNYAAGIVPESVTAADFNGDGKLDLVVSNNGSANVSVLLGNGDGTFKPAVDYPVGPFPQYVTVGDINGDGKLDLIVAIGGNSSGTGSAVGVLLGNGDGTFQPVINFTAGALPSAIAAGDFKRNGKLDLAVIDRSASAIFILLQN